MATTEVDICNLGLGRVRAKHIGSLSESSPEADMCRTLYPSRRDALLASYAWRFARTTRALALKDETPDEWAYAYNYPSDCLRIHYLFPQGAGSGLTTTYGIATQQSVTEPVPYEVGGSDDSSRRIWTNLDDAYASYTKRVTTVSLFDPLFTESLAWFLAIDLSIPLGGDSAKKYRDDAENGFEKSVAAAYAHSGNEAQAGQPRLPRSIRARSGSVNSDYFIGDKAYRR